MELLVNKNGMQPMVKDALEKHEKERSEGINEVECNQIDFVKKNISPMNRIHDSLF